MTDDLPITKPKVLAYITSIRRGVPHLLVHRHRDFPDAGLQVPAGSIDRGESPEEAVLRESFEESGLDDLLLGPRLGRYTFAATWENALHDRHVFHLEAGDGGPDSWEHTVSAGERDQGLVFCYEWLSLDGDFTLAGGQGDLLGPLHAAFAQARFREILFRSEAFAKAFERAPSLGLPNWYLGAGFLTQTVWNHLCGFPILQNIKDLDLVYFDAGDLSETTEGWVEARAAELFRDIPLHIDVKNQARVHLWYEGRFGYPIDPYRSAEAAVATWPTTASAVGVRRKDGAFDVCAPFGLSDLLGMIARPNKAQITEEIYLAKVERWQAAWPRLQVMPW